VHHESLIVSLERVRRDEQVEVDHEQELDFEQVDLFTSDTANLSEVGVVKILVVEKLRCQHH